MSEINLFTLIEKGAALSALESRISSGGRGLSQNYWDLTELRAGICDAELNSIYTAPGNMIHWVEDWHTRCTSAGRVYYRCDTEWLRHMGVESGSLVAVVGNFGLQKRITLHWDNLAITPVIKQWALNFATAYKD